MSRYVKFLRDHQGERFGFGEGHIVSVGEGHNADAISDETAAEYLKDGVVEKVSAHEGDKYHKERTTGPGPVAPPEEEAVPGASGRASAAEHPNHAFDRKAKEMAEDPSEKARRRTVDPEVGSRDKK